LPLPAALRFEILVKRTLLSEAKLLAPLDRRGYLKRNVTFIVFTFTKPGSNAIGLWAGTRGGQDASFGGAGASVAEIGPRGAAPP
jgi:hypothetical protein